jgi:hypothetical protein
MKMNRLAPLCLLALLCVADHSVTKAPVRVIFFEIIPAAWTGPTVIPPKS